MLQVLVIISLLSAGVYATTVYHWDYQNNPDWYSGPNAMTVVEPTYAWVFNAATTNGGYATPKTDQIAMRLLNTGGIADLWGNGQGLVPCGAEWVAPAGEIITKVEMAGSYRSDYGTVRYRISGGVDDSTETVYLEGAGIVTLAGVFYNYGGYGAGSGLVGVDIPVADGVTKVQLNPYVLSGGTEVVCFPATDPTYQGNIVEVNITTEPIPEPMTLTLLGVGSLLLIRRKKA